MPPDLNAPDLIAGRYRVDRAVGRGGMGTVWLCLDETLHRLVAVKQVGVVVGDTRRVMREARTAAALNHRSAVSIYDVVEHEGSPWLVMEYFSSRTLSEVLADGPLPAARVATIGAQVAAALASAHDAGVVHRDVKPSNILVGDDDIAKLSDFGIARIAYDDQLTETGLLVGTPAYFAPEVARGGAPGPESDAWALGATLYAAVEGRPPHPKQANAVATLAAIVSEPVPRPVRAGVLTDVIGHLMHPDPAARWSMERTEQALLALRTTAETRTAPATPAAPGTPAPVVGPTGSSHRSRFFPVAIGLAALLLLGIAAAVLLGTRDPEDPPGTAGETADSSSAPTPSQTPEEDESPPAESQAMPEPTEATTTPAAPTPAATGTVEALETYFATVPGDLDAGWAMLAPAMQDRVGRDSYDSFWATISAVDVSDVRAVDEDTVSAQVTYTRTDGTRATEGQTLELQPDDDGYLIAADR